MNLSWGLGQSAQQAVSRVNFQKDIPMHCLLRAFKCRSIQIDKIGHFRINFIEIYFVMYRNVANINEARRALQLIDSSGLQSCQNIAVTIVSSKKIS